MSMTANKISANTNCTSSESNPPPLSTAPAAGTNIPRRMRPANTPSIFYDSRITLAAPASGCARAFPFEAALWTGGYHLVAPGDQTSSDPRTCQRLVVWVSCGMGAPARAQPVQLASLEVVTQASSSIGRPQYVSFIPGLATCTLPIPLACRMFIYCRFFDS